MRLRRWLCFASISLASASAWAGPIADEGLIRADLALAIPGLPPLNLIRNPYGAHFYADSRRTLHPGSAFATGLCVGNVSGCYPTSGLPVPITRVLFELGDNGGLDFVDNDTVVSPCCVSGAGITGSIRYRAKIGKTPSFTLVRVPLNLGAPGTRISPTTPSPSLVASYIGDSWHLAPVTATGLTRDFAPLSDVMATGGVSVTGGGAQVVNLVSLARVRTRGLMNGTEVVSARLTLRYDADATPPTDLWFCPEPGGLTLLGAAAGVAIAGRNLRRRTHL
ncbi:MAG TPA: hypothetical protein VFT98_18140 [Myxococcota bacterium]|nr:hypothetical protein [Myxococcota bacterium]